MRLYLIPRLVCLPICLASAQDAATAQRTALPTTEPAKVGMSEARLSQVPEALQKLVDDGKVAGAIVTVARKGKIVLNEAVGFADKEAKKPMQTDSVVRIYSMTKPITSVGVMMLAEQGKLKP